MLSNSNAYAYNKTDLFCVNPGKNDNFIYYYSYAYKMRVSDNCKTKIINPDDEYYNSLNSTYEDLNKGPGDLFMLDEKLWNWIFKDIKPKTVVKKEPSQTQQKGREVTFCQHKVSKSNLYIANTKNCWNDRYKSISEVDYVIYFLGNYQDSVSVTKATLTNNLNTLYADYSRNNLKKSRIHQIIKTTDKLKAYLPIIDKSKETQVAKKEDDKSNNDQANLEEEKRKIEEEKKKIEEEKRKIAEAKKKQEEEEKQRKEANAKLYIIGSGTGFFVSAEGHIVSNDHVVGICRKVASKIDGEIEYFNIIKTDEVNDLGIIKGEYKNPTYLSIKSDGAEYGEDVVAFGYPLADALSTSVKLTRGIVSSLSGPGNNYSEIQIDAAIQPGNSGGPVLNMEGQVVGVASSGLNKLYMLEQSEYIPENVNFAVAAPTLANFLKANGVKVNTEKFKINNTKELARIGRPATLQLFCMNTKAVFEELKQKKKHSDVLFEKVIDLR